MPADLVLGLLGAGPDDGAIESGEKISKCSHVVSPYWKRWTPSKQRFLRFY